MFLERIDHCYSMCSGPPSVDPHGRITAGVPALDTTQYWAGINNQPGEVAYDAYQLPSGGFDAPPGGIDDFAYNLGGGQTGFVLSDCPYGNLNQGTAAYCVTALTKAYQLYGSTVIVINGSEWPTTFDGSTYPTD